MTIFLPFLVAALTTPVHVVYVNSPDLELSRREVIRAFAYWNELSPCNPRLHIREETHIDLVNPYDFFQYREAAKDAPLLTVYIVNNEFTKAPFDLGGGGYGFGYADPYSQAIVVMTHYSDAHGLLIYPNTGQTLAHELGHKLYRLPHGREGVSIMSFPDLAFREWVIHPEDYAAVAAYCGRAS